MDQHRRHSLEIILAFVCAYFVIAWDTILPRLPQCFLAMLYTVLLAIYLVAFIRINRSKSTL